MDRSRQIQEIVKECLQQWSEGKAVDDIGIVDAHPELAPELAEELRKLRLVGKAAIVADSPLETLPTAEQAAHRDGLRVRCPHCRNAMEVIEDSVDLRCDSCGGGISFSNSSDDAPAAPRRLGHFRLESMLGTGAFGSVWLAHDEELDRDVAVKIPRRSQLDPSQSEQIFREARIAAQLDHPNIVAVHEIGRDRDTVYIVSDLVQGIPLSQWMQERTLTVKEIASLCETLASALQHAHDLGVVHRDLKPANIMMDQQDQPRIMDFGLAKRDVGEITMTADGQVLGTPAYMSPEQAKGDSHRVDGRSDVYSLGVMLFELLTGELPFRGSAGMLIEQVIYDEPPSPRRLAGNAPRDLETICLKCLAKDRFARYSSAKLLAAEFGRFRRGEPIQARPVSRIDRAWRWCKRYPTAALSLALIGFLAVVGPALAWHESALRSDLQERYGERAKMIRELEDKKDQLEMEIGIFTGQLPTTVNQNAARQSLASLAAAKYGKNPTEQMSLERLIGTGMILAANNDIGKAIDMLEAARRRFDEGRQGKATHVRLAKADCCLRLSRLYGSRDKTKSIERAREAEAIAEQIIVDDPNLIAYTMRDQARSCLALTISRHGDPKKALEVIRFAQDGRAELDSRLPNDDAEIYQLACHFFSNVPPLLNQNEGIR